MKNLKNFFLEEIEETIETISLKNQEIDEEPIKFLSYSGKYPTLCDGILVLLIEGQEISFGEGADHYDSFWRSGGCCRLDRDFDHAETRAWIIEHNKLPKRFEKYSCVIEEIFNSNVPHGCCGGCL